MALDVKAWSASWPSTAGKPFSVVTLYNFSSEYQKYGKEDEMEVSFCEEMREALPKADVLQKPEYLIMVSYQQSFEDIMASIEWHAEARGLPDTTVYWAWFFAYSPRDVREWNWDQGSPTDVILDHIDGVALCASLLNGMLSPFGRANPCAELLQVWKRQLLVDVCCTTGVRATMRPFSNRSYEFGAFDTSIAEGMLAYDVRQIDRAVGAGGAGRAEFVLDQIESSMDGGLEAFNSNVHLLASGPLVLKACCDGDVKKILQIVNRSKVDFASPRLRGLQGETPLMVASACGHEAVVNFLLKRKADIAEEDVDGENAMHYAAATGRVEPVRILLAGWTGAAENQSFDERTPLDLALQNPAFFVGMDTDAVVKLLQLESHFRDVLSRRSALDGIDTPSKSMRVLSKHA
jgi:hypothetical protein